MDYVPGKDLRTLMTEALQARTFLDELAVLEWSTQLADALTFMHSQSPPILHRDIKPSNIKVTPSGIVKLVDFGLVKLLAKGEATITILQGRGRLFTRHWSNMAVTAVTPIAAAIFMPSVPRFITCSPIRRQWKRVTVF